MSVQSKSQLESQQLDVVLVAGGKEIRANKRLLSARSPVFAAMFAHRSTKEAQENRVEVADVDAMVLKIFVRYINTGKVGMLDRYAEDLWVVADKYLIDCLKSVCEQHLLRQISSESVSDLLIFADLYHVTKLYHKCLNFITSEIKGSRVFATKGWKNIRMRADLIGKLFQHLHSKYRGLIQLPEQLLVTAANDNCQLDNQINSQAITVESVLELLILADTYHVGELHRKCLEYIAKNLTQVIASGEWKKIVAKPVLLANICERVNFDFSEQLLLCPITVETVSNLLILADANRVPKVVNKCFDFIIENGTQVMQQADWKKIMARADLLIELFGHLYLKYSRLMKYIAKCADSESDFSHDSDDNYDYDFD